MDNLPAALATLVARHEADPIKDFDALITELKEVAGYRSLTAGEKVELEWEAVEQDGYAFRAISVRTAESENNS